MKNALVALLTGLAVFAGPGLAAQPPSVPDAAANVGVQIRFIDSATGYAVQPDSVSARPHRAGASEQRFQRSDVPSSGRGLFALKRGRHTVTALSAAHHPITGELEAMEQLPFRIHFLLDPLVRPRELQSDYIQALHRDGATLFHGFIVDDDSGEPLGGVRVRSLPGNAEGVSDARGYFLLHVPLPDEAAATHGDGPDQTPFQSSAGLVFEKPGYRGQERRHLELWSRGDWAYRIRLARGGGRELVDERASRRREVRTEETESSAAGTLKTLSAEQAAALSQFMAEMADGDIAAASAVSNATLRVPRNIRVEKDDVIYYVSMNFYAKHVLPREWPASWNYTSLYAGSVAVRSYAINRINNRAPTSTNDICGTSACQVFNPNSESDRTNLAVDYTEGHVLINANGNIASTEYSAENNSLDRPCGDGFTAPSGGCLYDPICIGRERNGHGRGMCQRGSRRWGNGDNGFPARTWTWILKHYYPNLRLVKGAELVMGDDVRSRSSDCQVRACLGGGIENGVACSLITTKASGQTGVIIGGPIRVLEDGHGFTWYQVRWNDAGSTTGWSCENYLERLFSAPTPPASLTATAVATNRINLSWTDTSDVETGFYVERAPAAAGPWMEIATLEVDVTIFSDLNLLPGSTWYYRVRAYNAAGNTSYTPVAEATTPTTVAPTLPLIPNRTVSPGTLILFTNSASAPERTQLLTDFEAFMSETANGVVLFRTPNFSTSTTNFLNGAPEMDLAAVIDTHPVGNGSGRALYIRSEFTNASNPWVRLTTAGAATLANPVIHFTRKLRFDVYADNPVKIAVGCRETTTPAGTAIGADGGTSGSSIEWAGVTNVSGGAPMPTRTVSNVWTTLTFDFPNEPIRSFAAGNNVLSTTSGLGVLEHLAIVPAGGVGIYQLYLDNFSVVGPRTFTYSLGAGAPANASLHPTTGVFSWTPTLEQSPSTNQISVIVTDDSVPPFRTTNTFTVFVRENAPNNPPMLYPIENRTVYSGTTIIFTNVAYDPDVVDTLTFSLDPGAPPAASIHPVTGVFAWTTSSADTNSIHYVTVRATDDGQPPLSGSATFSITVIPPPPPNRPPMLYPIENRSIHAGSTLTFTNVAFDPDEGDTLTFSLDPAAPLGASIQGFSGVFTWTPGDAESNTTKQITVRVTDDGSPPMSGAATFFVTVLPRPPNQPPVLAPVADRIVHASSLITFTNSASDPDAGDTLRFTLDEEAPPGAVIDDLTGVFTWTPSDAESNTTNSLTVLVTDDGEPPLTASATFTVTVKPRPALVDVSASGSTATLTWSAIPGVTYRVEYKDQLDNPNWGMLSPEVTADSALATASDTEFGSNPHRFYRIVARPSQ